MFKGLDWRAAARRSALVIAIYLGVYYVMSVAFPKNFGLGSSGQIISLLIPAAIFFLVFTVMYAFIGRSRERRLAEMRAKEKQKTPARAKSDGQTESGPLKGRPNPHTSRKKTRRRR